MQGHGRTTGGDASEVPRGAKVWACPTCRPDDGWATARDWAEDGYQRPVLAVLLPATWNIDAWGSNITSRIPTPWRLHIDFQTCGPRCLAPPGPGALWPTGGPDDSDTDSGDTRTSAEDSTADEDTW